MFKWVQGWWRSLGFAWMFSHIPCLLYRYVAILSIELPSFVGPTWVSPSQPTICQNPTPLGYRVLVNHREIWHGKQAANVIIDDQFRANHFFSGKWLILWPGLVIRSYVPFFLEFSTATHLLIWGACMFCLSAQNTSNTNRLCLFSGK